MNYQQRCNRMFFNFKESGCLLECPGARSPDYETAFWAAAIPNSDEYRINRHAKGCPNIRQTTRNVFAEDLIGGEC
ncbi:hypothetical protein ACFWAR_27910 [Streptomyces sp. NPDC059917]|uniref:hypothetical protein n=1 Tax=Streptomyces sp. NPDC059917 TaxID=3347002 RepID=UPI003662BE6C